MEKRLRDNLKAANVRLDKAIKALAPKHKGGEIEEWEAADQAVLKAERELSKYLNEAYAVEINFPIQWDIGAPLPHLLQSDYQAFLVFLIGSPMAGDGSSIQVMTSDSNDEIGIVEFIHCAATKMGDPNDEVFHGHPLDGHGLRAYKPMKVENSSWITELAAINSVHDCYDPKTWEDKNHYIFGFHDTTFECVADSFSVRTSSKSIRTTLVNLCENLN